MKRFLVLLAILALPSLASAQLVTPLSVGNANCPFGGVSISVVTALPNTVQTSYICTSAPTQIVIGGDGSPMADYYAQGDAIVYWDGNVFWETSSNGSPRFPGTATVFPTATTAVYADNACTTQLADSTVRKVQYGYAASTGFNQNYVPGNPVSVSTCYAKPSGFCVVAACPAGPADFDVIGGIPSVSLANQPYSIAPSN